MPFRAISHTNPIRKTPKNQGRSDPAGDGRQLSPNEPTAQNRHSWRHHRRPVNIRRVSVQEGSNRPETRRSRRDLNPSETLENPRIPGADCVPMWPDWSSLPLGGAKSRRPPRRFRAPGTPKRLRRLATKGRPSTLECPVRESGLIQRGSSEVPWGNGRWFDQRP
jgi:hypothetical protein